MTKPRLAVLAFLSLALTGTWASANAPARRYTVSGGVVSDTRTKLSWRQTPPAGTYSWLDGRNYCTGLGTGWRLPTFKELTTIVDFGKTAPAIDTTAFLGTHSAAYWSLTFLANNGARVWGVNFSNGDVAVIDIATTNYVRCVRWDG